MNIIISIFVSLVIWTPITYFFLHDKINDPLTLSVYLFGIIATSVAMSFLHCKKFFERSRSMSGKIVLCFVYLLASGTLLGTILDLGLYSLGLGNNYFNYSGLGLTAAILFPYAIFFYAASIINIVVVNAFIELSA